MNRHSYARVMRMLENKFHPEQSGKARKWNNEQRANCGSGPRLDKSVRPPRHPHPAPPLPSPWGPLAALRSGEEDQ
jgi:hypothetical protein